ncbi:zinc ribbon domain-containing protein [Dictyobacter kobayashii]|uniref:DZANK-type domain-containing protein n=1 Tax=Dictyobacter kobayashii TaxID=2014872 RepID=A0A402AZ08_9CHLR|nr:zinc ribbon domain-containing protein [Dictyobacter kobayashii]GCE24344.1 hypothetical protein KDK_81440 [Dictyobacter kobayashii]
MEERVYQGNIDPTGLADYLVNTFHQNYDYMGYSSRYTTMAQKVGQDDHLLVQIARARAWSGRIRSSLGVSISRVPGGVSVSIGQSNWFDDPAIAGSLIGAIFWPPLLLFPLIRGARNFGFYQDVWDAVDTYCNQSGATPGSTTTAHGVYCNNCGSVNDEGVSNCHTCGAPLHAQQPAAQASPSTVTCPNCNANVSDGKFCSNCAAHPSRTRLIQTQIIQVKSSCIMHLTQELFTCMILIKPLYQCADTMAYRAIRDKSIMRRCGQ